MLLGQRRYSTRLADLQRLLESPREPPRIRALAAQQLALVATPAALAALRKGLAARDAVTLRSVVDGLAWAGDLGSLAAIDRIARRRGPATLAAKWDALLLRFRYGKSGGALPPRGRPLRSGSAPLDHRVGEAGDHRISNRGIGIASSLSPELPSKRPACIGP